MSAYWTEYFVKLPCVSGARVGCQQCIRSQSCQPNQTQNPEDQSNTDLQREQGEWGQEQPGTHTLHPFIQFLVTSNLYKPWKIKFSRVFYWLVWCGNQWNQRCIHCTNKTVVIAGRDHRKNEEEGGVSYRLSIYSLHRKC